MRGLNCVCYAEKRSGSCLIALEERVERDMIELRSYGWVILITEVFVSVEMTVNVTYFIEFK